MGQAIPYVIMAAAAGAQHYNTERTARRQDQQAAEGIRQQGRLQRDADARVGQEVESLAASNAADERRQRLEDYMTSLRRNQSTMGEGLAPMIGSDAFREDSARGLADATSQTERTAGLMSRMDAPMMQRQGEAFGYGNLATDIGLIGRRSAGDAFINDLRLRGIRRNPWIDFGSQVAMNSAGAMGGGGGGSEWAPSYYGEAGRSPISGVTVRGGGTGWQGNSAFGRWGQGWGG